MTSGERVLCPLKKGTVKMADRTVTLTIPEELYEKSQKLVDAGLYDDFSVAVQAGLRSLLDAYFDDSEEPPGLDGPAKCAFYLERIRDKIEEEGGLFPGKSAEEVIEILRETRRQIYEEKYAAHFGRE